MKKRRKAEIHVQAKFKDKEGEFDIYHFVNAEALKDVPREVMDAERLKMLSPNPVSGIYKTFAHFNFVVVRNNFSSVELKFSRPCLAGFSC